MSKRFSLNDIDHKIHNDHIDSVIPLKKAGTLVRNHNDHIDTVNNTIPLKKAGT